MQYAFIVDWAGNNYSAHVPDLPEGMRQSANPSRSIRARRLRRGIVITGGAGCASA